MKVFASTTNDQLWCLLKNTRDERDDGEILIGHRQQQKKSIVWRKAELERYVYFLVSFLPLSLSPPSLSTSAWPITASEASYFRWVPKRESNPPSKLLQTGQQASRAFFPFPSSLLTSRQAFPLAQISFFCWSDFGWMRDGDPITKSKKASTCFSPVRPTPRFPLTHEAMKDLCC